MRHLHLLGPQRCFGSPSSHDFFSRVIVSDILVNINPSSPGLLTFSKDHDLLLYLENRACVIIIESPSAFWDPTSTLVAITSSLVPPRVPRSLRPSPSKWLQAGQWSTGSSFLLPSLESHALIPPYLQLTMWYLSSSLSASIFYVSIFISISIYLLLP